MINNQRCRRRRQRRYRRHRRRRRQRHKHKFVIKRAKSKHARFCSRN